MKPSELRVVAGDTARLAELASSRVSFTAVMISLDGQPCTGRLDILGMLNPGGLPVAKDR